MTHLNSSNEKRSTCRLPFGNQPCELVIKDKSYFSHVLDYSEGGCKIQYTSEAIPDTTIKIKLLFSFGDLQYDAEVRWSNEKLGTGLKFI